MEFLASSVSAISVRAHSHPVQTLAFNKNGKVLATGDTMRIVRAWMNSVPVLEANVQSRNLKGWSTDRIRGIAFANDGARMYVISGDTLRAFDLLERSEVWRYQPPRSFGFLVTSPVAVAVSPSGNVITVSDAGLVAVLDDDGNILRLWSDNEAPRHLAFTGDGLELAGADGFSVSVWEPYTGRRVRSSRTKERIFGMALDPLRGIIAARTLHNILLIEVKSLDILDRLPAPSGLPLIAFSPDGSQLALGGREEVLLLDTTTRKCIVLPVQGARVVSIAFDPMGTRLTAGCSDGQVRFWNPEPFHLL